MLYVLYGQDYDNGSDPLGVWDGPDGLDINQLRRTYNKLYEVLPKPSYPKYKGPKIPYKPPTRRLVSCSSGAFSFGGVSSGCLSFGVELKPGDLIDDTNCPEYRAWQKKKQTIYQRYDKQVRERAKQLAKDYPQGFISYLEKNFTFIKVESQECSI